MIQLLYQTKFKENTEIDNTLQARAAIKTAYFLSHIPKRFENEYIKADNRLYRWQPPPTSGPYVSNGNSGLDWDVYIIVGGVINIIHILDDYFGIMVVIIIIIMVIIIL